MVAPRLGRRLGCAAAVGLVAFGGACAWTSSDAGADAVEAELLADRFTVGRLGRQTAWQPCMVVDSTTSVPRSRCGPRLEPGSNRFGRVTELTRRAFAELTADSVAQLHTRALAELRWHETVPARLDRAVALLERVRDRAPNDTLALVDLAVAYLALGERHQQLRPLLQALETIDRAGGSNARAPSVRFDRALILERLYLLESARRAWTQYLAVETDAAWRREAEARLRRLTPPNDSLSWRTLFERRVANDADARAADVTARVRRSPQDAREFCFTLLGEWGVALGRGDTVRAAEPLALARAIADALDAMGGDRSATRALSAIDRHAADNAATRALAAAHADYAAGLALYVNAAYDDADAPLARAERTLRALGSGAAGWTEFYRAATRINRGDYAGADDHLRAVLGGAAPEEPALRGKAVWALGVSQLRRGSYEAASRLYRDAAPAFARAQEGENLGAISYLLTEALTLAGQSTAGREEALRGLQRLAPYRRSIFLNNHLTTVARYAREEGLSHAAVDVMTEVVDVAHGIGRPQTMAWAHRARARDFVLAARAAEADADLAAAGRWAETIKAGRGRDRVVADVLLARAELRRERDPEGALVDLAQVVREYRRLRSDVQLPGALYQAALAARATGRSDVARAYLVDAIAAIESQGTAFETAEARATFRETAERVFDAVIDLEQADGRGASALAYLERARIASWGGAVRRHAGALDVATIQRRIPRDMLLAEYALLDDRLLVWAIGRDRWRQLEVPVDRDTIAALAGRVVDDAGNAAGRGVSDARARLFDLLLRPLGAELGGVRRLAVVPDRELTRVPFGALWDRDAGRYVVETLTVHTLPSAEFFVEARAPATAARDGEAVLVVGAPSVDEAAMPRLGPLPGAEREASQIARLYGIAAPLTGRQARRDTLLARLASSTVFHFAGHAVVDAEQPERSYLALAAGDGGDDGVLRAQEIGALRLSTLRIAVLSACSSLNPKATHVGPIVGLAYSFLRAGVPATVSSLWDVGDAATTELLVEFHRRFAAGVPAAEALRQAQMQALKSPRAELRAPRSWAAFIYTGP